MMIFMEVSLSWLLQECTIPVVQQGVWITVPVVVTAAILRACVLLRVPPGLVHSLSIAMGLVVLYFFYSIGVVFFLTLCAIVYGILLIITHHRGVAVATVSLLFLFIW